MTKVKATTLAGITSLVVLVVLGWLFVLSPRFGLAGEIRRETHTLRQQNDTLRAAISELTHKQANLPTQREYAQALAARMPAEADQARLFAAVRTAAARAGIPEKNIVALMPAAPVMQPSPTPSTQTTTGAGRHRSQPQVTKPAPGTVATMSLDLTVVATANQVVRFLNELENMDRAILIDRITITTDGTGGQSGRYSTKIHGTLFVAPAPIDPDQATPATK